MSDNKRYYWIKIKTDFFDLPTIDWLQEQKNGYEYIVLYQKLCLLSANSGGELVRRVGEMIIPYDVKKIAEVTRFKFDTVVVAIELYKKVGLIIERDDGVLIVSGIGEMVGSETKWAEKKRLHQANKLPALTSGICRRVNRETIMLPNGKTQYVDEKRYGGNGALAFDRAGCKCQRCGTEDRLLIHHNNGYSNAPEDLVILCESCHGIIHSAEYGGVFRGNNGGKTSAYSSGQTSGQEGGNYPPHTPQDAPPITPHKRSEIRDQRSEYRDQSIDNIYAAAANARMREESPNEKDHGAVFRAFSDNIHPITGEIERDRIVDLTDEYGALWVKSAIEEAALSNGRSLRYITAILERWRRDGFKVKRKGDGCGNTGYRRQADSDEDRYADFREADKHQVYPWEVQSQSGSAGAIPRDDTTSREDTREVPELPGGVLAGGEQSRCDPRPDNRKRLRNGGSDNLQVGKATETSSSTRLASAVSPDSAGIRNGHIRGLPSNIAEQVSG